MTDEAQPTQPDPDRVERLRRQLGPLDMRQIAIWREMTPARRLAIVFQAYRFALRVVQATEQRQHPDLPAEELQWRVIQAGGAP